MREKIQTWTGKQISYVGKNILKVDRHPQTVHQQLSLLSFISFYVSTFSLALWETMKNINLNQSWS